MMTEFDIARKLYDGRKLGLTVEFDRLHHVCKKHKLKINNVVPLLRPAIEREIAYRKQLNFKGEFVPPWKHFQTWLNNQCWTQEFPGITNKTYFIPRCPDCDKPLNSGEKQDGVCLQCKFEGER